MTIWAIFSGLILLPVSSVSGATEQRRTQRSGLERVAAAEACPQLFGDQQQRKRNARFRRSNLHWFVQERSGVTLAHSHQSWRYPVPLHVQGVSLEAVEPGRLGKGHAVLQLEEELASELGCDPGAYAVSPDASLGPKMQVLAVFSSGVLLAHEGRLGFMAHQATRPRFLMAWRLKGTVPASKGGPANNRATQQAAVRRQAAQKKAAAARARRAAPPRRRKR